MASRCSAALAELARCARSVRTRNGEGGIRTHKPVRAPVFETGALPFCHLSRCHARGILRTPLTPGIRGRRRCSAGVPDVKLSGRGPTITAAWALPMLIEGEWRTGRGDPRSARRASPTFEEATETVIAQSPRVLASWREERGSVAGEPSRLRDAEAGREGGERDHGGGRAGGPAADLVEQAGERTESAPANRRDHEVGGGSGLSREQSGRRRNRLGASGAVAPYSPNRRDCQTASDALTNS